MKHRIKQNHLDDQKWSRILHTAARLFHEQGYAQTSMNNVADSLGLTKAGLYHHIESKEQLLFEILNYGLDLLEEEVIRPVAKLEDPVERLRQLIRRHIRLILQQRCREITVILHENRTLRGKWLVEINRRKKNYIHLVEDILTAIQKSRPHPCIRPKLASFALLGMINWTYQWYDVNGAVSQEELTDQFTDLFLLGFLH
jgi:TetR/AcrR family transcriptional regulator, cholesterol catabolism regulator